MQTRSQVSLIINQKRRYVAPCFIEKSLIAVLHRASVKRIYHIYSRIIPRLSKDWELHVHPVPWVVESQVDVQSVDLLDLLLSQSQGLLNGQVGN